MQGRRYKTYCVCCFVVSSLCSAMRVLPRLDVALSVRLISTVPVVHALIGCVYLLVTSILLVPPLIVVVACFLLMVPEHSKFWISGASCWCFHTMLLLCVKIVAGDAELFQHLANVVRIVIIVHVVVVIQYRSPCALCSSGAIACLYLYLRTNRGRSPAPLSCCQLFSS